MFFQKNVQTKEFLVPLEERYNSGFGKDFAIKLIEKLSFYHMVSNVLEAQEGVGFWLNIKKERYWFNIKLLNAKEHLWEITIKPVGLSYWLYLLTRQTFHGKILLSEIDCIFKEMKLNILLKK